MKVNSYISAIHFIMIVTTLFHLDGPIKYIFSCMYLASSSAMNRSKVSDFEYINEKKFLTEGKRMFHLLK